MVTVGLEQGIGIQPEHCSRPGLAIRVVAVVEGNGRRARILLRHQDVVIRHHYARRHEKTGAPRERATDTVFQLYQAHRAADGQAYFEERARFEVRASDDALLPACAQPFAQMDRLGGTGLGSQLRCHCEGPAGGCNLPAGCIRALAAFKHGQGTRMLVV